MMGVRTVAQEPLIYEFSMERHVPADHFLRSVERFVDLYGIREHLPSFYSEMGRLSIDPEPMIRMLIVGYCMGIRSERRLCDESVHLNLAYRWFCSLGLDGDVPDHSKFSNTRHGRFRVIDLLRQLFEATVKRSAWWAAMVSPWMLASYARRLICSAFIRVRKACRPISRVVRSRSIWRCLMMRHLEVQRRWCHRPFLQSAADSILQNTGTGDPQIPGVVAIGVRPAPAKF